jgi:hypothetical protein
MQRAADLLDSKFCLLRALEIIVRSNNRFAIEHDWLYERYL